MLTPENVRGKKAIPTVAPFNASLPVNVLSGTEGGREEREREGGGRERGREGRVREGGRGGRKREGEGEREGRGRGRGRVGGRLQTSNQDTTDSSNLTFYTTTDCVYILCGTCL